MAGKRGGARPGAGRKPGKVSAAKKTIMSAAAEHGATALRVLVEVATDPGAPASARISAANALLDRGYGKPLLQTGTDTSSISREMADWLQDLQRKGSRAPIRELEAG
jgi:hypothetical protein